MEFSKVIFLFFGLIALSKSKPTQDELQIEVRELLNQYQMADAINEDHCPHKCSVRRLNFSGLFPCPA